MLIDVFVIYLSLHGPFEASFYEITFGRRPLMEKKCRCRGGVGVWWAHKNIIEPKGWLRHVLLPHNQNPPYPSSLPGDDDRPWRFPFLPACAVLFNVTGGLWAFGVLNALSTLTPSHGHCDRAKNLFEIKDGANVFWKLCPENYLGSMWDIAFKRKPCEPRADHPSSVLTYIKHLGKSEKSVEIMDGTLTEL